MNPKKDTKGCVSAKVFHTAVAPYFADTYNTLVSVVQGVVLGALFYAFTKQTEFNLLFSLKAFVVFLSACLMWHRYITHTQFAAWKLSFTDTLIPMGFAIVQFLLILTIMKEESTFWFSLTFTSLTLVGIMAYANTDRMFKDASNNDLLKEHFGCKTHADIVLEELYKYGKKSTRHVFLIFIISAIITILNYGVECISERSKAYLTVIAFSVSLLSLCEGELREHLATRIRKE